MARNLAASCDTDAEAQRSVKVQVVSAERRYINRYKTSLNKVSSREVDPVTALPTLHKSWLDVQMDATLYLDQVKVATGYGTPQRID